MLTEQALETIQSDSIEEVYQKITNVALHMAASGFLEQANQLLSELWKHNLPHDKNTWLQDIAFTVLWHASGVRPEKIPFELQDIDSIERNMRGYIAMDRWAYKMPDKSWTELSGQDLLRKAFITAGHFSAEAELEALSMLEKMTAENFTSDEGLALGAELAARNGQTERAINLIKSWARGYQNPSTRFRPELLASSRHAAPLLLNKVIAAELNLSESTVNFFLTQVTTTLDGRLMQGRTLAYGHLDWNQLIEEMSHAAINSSPELFENDVIDSNWLGFQGADAQAIAETENRLGISLPEDYKSFLQVSNGLRSIGYTSSELLPASEIDYINKILPRDYFERLCDFPMREDDAELLESTLSRGIMISKYPDDQMVWLIAPKDESDTWQAWFFANWVPGDRRFLGFRYFMENQLMILNSIRNQP